MIGAAVLAAALTLSPTAVMHHATQVPAHMQDFKACVAHRESHGNPKAIGDQSSARGKYQFLKAWNHGLPYQVAERLTHFGMSKAEANRIRTTLQHKTIDKWSEQLQDVAFAAVIAHHNGWRHWYIAGSRCNQLASK